MLSLSDEQSLEIAGLGLLSDCEIRSDLSRGYITGENDYTSNFTGAFRRNVNTYATSGIKASSLVLTNSIEQVAGCDAAILICGSSASKIAMFEAKWPRILKPGYSWDRSQGTKSTSHFTDQLRRQRKLTPRIAVFEMFYCECEAKDTPKFMSRYGSTCVWHEDAYDYLEDRANQDDNWDDGDLESMFSRGSANIHQILMAICECSQGLTIPMTDPEEIAVEFKLPSGTLVISTETG